MEVISWFMNQRSHPIPIPSPILPADALPDDALRLHAPRAVVEVCEGRGHRGVERQQLLLTRLPWRRFIRNVIHQTISSSVRWNSSRMVHGCCKRMMVAVYDNVYSSLCDSLFCVHQTISQVQRAIIHKPFTYTINKKLPAPCK